MLVDNVVPFREAGFALHWLRTRSKAPVAEGWSSAPVASVEVLRSSFQPGYNVGVRLGEPSRVAGGYLHALDIDIRVPELADEAWDAVRMLLGDISPESLPSVASGSGGESRHLYFVSDKPFFSRKLAVSEGKHRKPHAKGWSYDWEIDLFGTGKQVAMPPSIHPDTGNAYTWERPFDFTMLALGVAPTVPAARLAEIADPTLSTYEFETVEPLTFKSGQLEKELDALSDDRIDDYHDWVTLGQALHHQFGASDEGYHLWLKHSKRSEKFDEREMPGKWRSFGRNRRRPVTLATVRQWYIEQRQDEFNAIYEDAFEDLDDEPTTTVVDSAIEALLGGDIADPVDPLDAPVSDDEDPLDTAVKLPWYSLLDYNEEGGIRPNLHNVTLLVTHDVRLASVPEFNEFTQEIVQRRGIGVAPEKRKNAAKPAAQLRPDIWVVTDEVNGTLWNDSRDNDLRRVFEAPKTQAGHGVKVTDRDLHAAIDIVARQQPFHPIREYLEAHKWDGVSRVDRLFIDHLGAPDNPYSREIATLMMIAAVARVYEPGHKFDFAVIIEGIQGKRKSTFIQALGRNWFAELDGDFHDTKQMVELMQGAWIMEIPELSGFNRADVRAIKAFISRQHDRARLAYARRAGEFPRQCIFIGSTNDREYLKDDTGGRRFWPVYCTVGTINVDRLVEDVDQLWAEALHLYREMRRIQPGGTLPLYVRNPEAQVIARDMQETRRVESADDGLVGAIADWLGKPINTGGIDDQDGVMRSETCLIQIWVECLGGRRDNYNQVQAQSIGRAMGRIEGWYSSSERIAIGNYGRQRVWRKV